MSQARCGFLFLCCLLVHLLTACGNGNSSGSGPAGPPPADASGLWTGTWSGTGDTTGSHGLTVVEVHQSGTDITGYVTISGLNLANAPITGTVQGSAISFGTINQQVKYSGTFTGPTSATGTYHATRWGGNDGTWSVTQVMPAFDDIPAGYPLQGVWSNVLTSTMNNGESRHPMDVVQSGNALTSGSGFLDQGWTITGRVSGAQTWFIYDSGLGATQFTLFTGTVGSAYTVGGNYLAYDLSGAPTVTDNGVWNATLSIIVAGAIPSTMVTNVAKLFDPTGVALDAYGNIFVADTQNNTIRQITPSGEVTTLAGTAGQTGDVDDTGAAARFYHPTGVAADLFGNVYVVDSQNASLRKIVVATGVVTTMMKDSWHFHPQGVAVDADGNVYVVARIDGGLRKVTPANVITTLAGTDGVFGSAVAVDSIGNVYVADDINNVIHQITPSGDATILAGTAYQVGSDDGTGAAARFDGPRGVAVDAIGNVYVADSSNHAIRKITPAGVVSTLLGVGTAPAGVAVDGAGNLFFLVDSAVLKTALN